jgi:hypothetical protein
MNILLILYDMSKEQIMNWKQIQYEQ